MAKIKYGNDVVDEDTPCLGLYELNLQSPGYKGFHRYQIIKVLRDNKEVALRQDLGPATKFKHDQIRILGGVYDKGRYYIEHTVGQLREIADHLRDKSSEEVYLDNLLAKQNEMKGRIIK